ncbi:MAG: UDP-N-acetylmuramoyl-L-alanyl-D-glutamate--2,6-diaminopimelate ligase [Clostridia bacterium]|nr:UDP-N-acetylmuramoyl-L-alanyl-D-glutamate--2,6-diaminopimelate ligase [Clostridia bacterium]MBR5410365.1 UDP-N-acetylmuramoyl-L-alanyl-D-glutamate--2,6-diaminopimelate ligase [Clostridia bacterium]
MLLSEIVKDLTFTCDNLRDCEIEGIVYDSRKASPGTLFAALVGAYSDGHDYVSSAYLAGARVFLTERDVNLPADAVVLKTADSRAALAVIAAAYYRHPEKELKLVGVTGTKGKTSIAGMLASCLDHAGVKCGTIGTVGAYYDGKIEPTLNTTPESLECMRLFRQMADCGCRAVVMEVSSLGLKAHRVDTIPFDAAVFTNLSPDHIGGNEHKSFEEYSYWKKQLFHQCKVAVLNADDPFSAEIAREIDVPVVTFALHADADYTARDVRPTRAKNLFGTAFTLVTKEGTYPCSTAVPGLFSVENALATAAVCGLLGVPMADAQAGLKQAKVIGRNDCIEVPADFDVIIDYAHNGQSFKAVVDTFAAYEHKRIITVFGSVGDRAQLRRKELGLLSGKLADLSFITTDDPGFEDPEKICAEIAAWVKEAGGAYRVIPDRREAVFAALNEAKPGDVVLILGKGHETAQKVRGEKVPYSDYETVKDYFAQR